MARVAIRPELRWRFKAKLLNRARRSEEEFRKSVGHSGESAELQSKTEESLERVWREPKVARTGRLYQGFELAIKSASKPQPPLGLVRTRSI